jgi:hypothetical protein
MNGIVYWMGQSQFYRLAGNGVEPIKCPIWDVVFQDLDTNNLDKIRVAPNSRFGEIAWHFPMNGNLGITNIVGNGSSVTVTYSGVGTFSVGTTVTLSAVSPAIYNGAYVVVSTSGNTVTFVSTKTTPYVSGGLISGSLENNGYVKYNIAENLWDKGELTRTAGVDRSEIAAPIGAEGDDGYLQEHEASVDADEAAMDAWFETGLIPIDDGAQNFMHLDRVFPDFRMATGSTVYVTVTMYDSDAQDATGRVYGPFTVTSTTQFFKVDGRGKFAQLFIESSDLGSFWRVGDQRVRAAPAGRAGG